MQGTIDWLKTYFSEQTTVPDNVEGMNYFEAGLIDSFGVVIMIGTIEEHFHISFEQSHFTDRRFSTIQGLAEIIEELKQRKP